MSILEENKVLKNLIFGKWVDCDKVCKALNIDFSTGLKMFDFGRMAEWCKAPLNGQKITTKFKLKNSNDADFDEELEDFETVNESGWIPVSERLPKDSEAKISKKEQVLVCNVYGIMNAAYCHKGRWYKFSGKELAHIVAWQPLPPAFEVKENK